jgi:uncharacterized heparinase superfamily protein
MPYLKSIYFYFLAIKINLIKIIKKVFFTSSYYNKSLKTQIPKKFYFFPNSFLLSSITNYKNFSLNLTDTNVDKFWSKQTSKFEEKKINSFLWLNLIDRKSDGKVIQKIISHWINKNNKYQKKTWENPVVSKRVISWILNSEIIFSNTDAYFKENFLQSIVVQTNHLINNIKFEKNNSKKIEILTAILLSGLVFKEYIKNYNLAIKELEKLVEEFFDIDGFPLSRNPNHLLKFSKYLILIKECTKDAQLLIPDFLDEIIDKTLTCLKKVTTPESKIPLFNGGTEIEIEEYFNYINNLNYKIKSNNSFVGNLNVLKYKKHIVFFDVGGPPKKNYSRAYQCGPLSFEYYSDKKKIITNCGFGYNISKKAMLLSRLTSAQSTLSINETSVLKFERNKIINKAFGNSIKSSFKVFDFNFLENEAMIISEAAHDAYETSLGYIHKRVIKIDKQNESLIGTDALTNKKDIQTVRYDIRFHLSPGIEAVQTISGNSILIKVNKNKSLIFSSENQLISVEKSIFLGGNKILNNHCITITGNLNNENKIINWEIKKNIN